MPAVRTSARRKQAASRELHKYDARERLLVSGANVPIFNLTSDSFGATYAQVLVVPHPLHVLGACRESAKRLALSRRRRDEAPVDCEATLGPNPTATFLCAAAKPAVLCKAATPSDLGRSALEA